MDKPGGLPQSEPLFRFFSLLIWAKMVVMIVMVVMVVMVAMVVMVVMVVIA